MPTVETFPKPQNFQLGDRTQATAMDMLDHFVAELTVAQRSNGVIDKTPMEPHAVKEARRPPAEVLVELNLMTPFRDAVRRRSTASSRPA